MEAGVPVSPAQMEKQLPAADEAGRYRLPCSHRGDGCTAGAYKQKTSLPRSTTAADEVDINKHRAQGCSWVLWRQTRLYSGGSPAASSVHFHACGLPPSHAPKTGVQSSNFMDFPDCGYVIVSAQAYWKMALHSQYLCLLCNRFPWAGRRNDACFTQLPWAHPLLPLNFCSGPGMR